MNESSSTIDFNPVHILRNASPAQVEKLVVRCSATVMMATDVVKILVGADGSLDDARNKYHCMPKQMVVDTAEAVRRGMMRLPGIRFQWTVKDAGYRTRECIGVIAGEEADAEPPMRNDLSDIFRLNNMTIDEVAKASEIPISALTTFVGGQGRMKGKWFLKLSEMFKLSPKVVRAAFYHGCHRAAWKNPDLIMYPSSQVNSVPPVAESFPLPMDQVGKRRLRSGESIIKLADGFYKVSIERVG
jgi:hypothetical protein